MIQPVKVKAGGSLFKMGRVFLTRGVAVKTAEIVSPGEVLGRDRERNITFHSKTGWITKGEDRWRRE